VAQASAAQFPAPGRTAREELAAVRREFKELQDAVFEANRVQRKLCAPRELRRANFEMAGEMFAVRQLSGDFFKLFDLGSSVGFAVGDVAGKGIAAGMWLTHLVGLVRCHLEREPDLGLAMAEVNRGLCGLVTEPPLAALFLGRIELETGALTYCNAGQPEALVLRETGAVESLDAGGPMLGAIPAAKFEAGRTALAAGDTLVACTDGAVECRNARDEEFGPARLAAAASLGLRAGSAGQILFSTLGAVLDFANGRPVADDLTLLVLHRSAAASRGRAA
jgi:sigma-B regulation protein RsbU (phosphoserine phosphatase)